MATATALAVVEQTWDRGQLEIIKDQIARGVTDGELALFAQVCSRTGLDPFARQIYAIKRGDKMTIQTGIDGYRVLAARSGALAGIDEPTYDTEDDDHPNKATVTVWRMVDHQRCPFTATARWKEYVQSGPMWGKMPYLMLGKCAEALALRKAFPAELSGIYTGDEMSQADHEAPAAYVEQITAPAATSAPKPSKNQIESVANLAKWLGREVPVVETAQEAAIIIGEWGKQWAAQRKRERPTPIRATAGAVDALEAEHDLTAMGTVVP